jgi:hypothetical protein
MVWCASAAFRPAGLRTRQSRVLPSDCTARNTKGSKLSPQLPYITLQYLITISAGLCAFLGDIVL